MRPADVEKLSEPLCPEPDVCSTFWNHFCSLMGIAGMQLHILLPPLQKLRTVVERLRLMSDVLAIRANNAQTTVVV
jgi:HUS1 checkpoint protein